jgi:hypothetical protein
MSFMFETRFPQHLTEFAAKEAPLQDDYIDCWDSLEKKFDGTPGHRDLPGHRRRGDLGRARAVERQTRPLSPQSSARPPTSGL